MKASDRYHKWVEWSEDEQTYLAKCPDLITGIHGDDPVSPYGELCEIIEEVIFDLGKSGKPLPEARVRPTMELA